MNNSLHELASKERLQFYLQISQVYDTYEGFKIKDAFLSAIKAECH